MDALASATRPSLLHPEIHLPTTPGLHLPGPPLPRRLCLQEAAPAPYRRWFARLGDLHQAYYSVL